LLDKSDIKKDSAIIKFMVTKNGDLCQFSFFNTPTEYLRQCITKTFLQSPNWQPGTNDGGRLLNVYSQLLIVITTNRKTLSIQTNISSIKDRILSI